MSKLFNIENSDLEEKLNINTHYANNYNSWRQKEELHKLQSKYPQDIELSINSAEEFSTESSEDDEGKEIPQVFEKNFYKTLACLKSKDPKIYDKDVQFFIETKNENIINKSQFKKKKEKSLFVRDYERKILLERVGKFSDEDENKEKDKIYNPTYVQEQQELKQCFKKIMQYNKDNQDKDQLLRPKIKSKEEVQKEQNDYKEWLIGQVTDINEKEQKDLKSLRDFWTNPNLNQNERFLRDYVLNTKFLDKQSANYNSDYDNVIHDSDENLFQDEQNINLQEKFEHKYNFRFEEPDQEFLKRYPRTLKNSLRKKDNRRALKRAEVKIRKEQEKIKKKEEIKQLKVLKRKKIEERLEKLKEITGDDLKLNLLDLEEDFDPNIYDKKMSEIFNEEYYTKQEDVKPEFPDIDKELCIDSTWDDYDPTTEKIIQEKIPFQELPHCEDPEFNMDAEYNSSQPKIIQGSKVKKHRRRSKFAEMILKEKPIYDPKQYASYKEYYDQYYALDYEDIIGDLPCRFKYRQVVPNDYGLSIEEILMADDKELNKWCSLKTALEYKSEYKELNDVKTYKQKASNETLKRKIFKSLYNTPKNIKISKDNEDLEQQNIKKKYNLKNQTQPSKEIKIDKNKCNKNNIDKISLKENENIEKLSENGTQLNKSTDYSNKQNYIFDESLEENNEKLILNKKKLKNVIQNNIRSKCCTEKELYINKSQDSTKKLNKIQSKHLKKHKFNNKYKNKNTIVKKDVLNKKNQKNQFQKSKMKKKMNDNDQIVSLSAERLIAYGLNPKKFKNKLKYIKK